MEFPVGAIAGVALAGAPHRQGGAAVAAEEGGPGRRADRSEYAIAGAGQGVQQAVGIEHRVAQTAAHQLLIEAFVVGAFRQPDAQGPLTQQAFVLAHCGDQLGPHRLWHLAQQGQVAVGGTAGDQIEHPLLLQPAEAWDQLPFGLTPLVHHRFELGC